ncbi:xanthine dehydrogenase family protein molybdopterin-binding subunit [Limnohabitans sp. 2KL-27]|uniref:xanthine dehydrogenase family protein molybdopterin-binding subunit n=1 Tax=Limnohabitans sp. 2KL-27 TaxID=1100705 RepID=UPI000A975411|nr:molybdopterin cofactor-binding domain-containing protein [Limnohabitans sp. 2KL-27]
MKRRTWLLSALGATGAMVVGWSVLPARSRLGSPESMLKTEGDLALNGWIKIAADGSVVLAMPRSEMGQGVHTALAMLVAEEMDVPLSRVCLEQAGDDSIYGNVAMQVASLPFHPLDSEGEHKPTLIKMSEWVVGKVARELGINATGGSSSIADLWDPLRVAAAMARASLVHAAAAAWKVPASEITVVHGVMQHASGPSAHYGQMVAAASGSTPTGIQIKSREHWQLIGQFAPRSDIPSKVTGQAQFGGDVRLPGMLFATVQMCPMLGGSAASMDTKDTLALKGVSKVVPLDAWGGGTAGLAVVGQTTWHAHLGAQALKVQWQAPAAGVLDSQRIQADLLKALNTESGFTFHEQGVPAQAEKAAVTRIDALYQAPYLAHATMEPMNCTAQVKDGQVEIWVPTQVPQMVRDMAAKVAKVDKTQVAVHVTQLGGGFGRRLEVDFVGQAVQVAMACEGQPVQLSWSREEDMTHDFYRPMHLAKFQASLDDKGQVSSLRIKSAGDAITPRYAQRAVPILSLPVDMPDKTTSEGLFDLPYGFASQHMSHVATSSGVPVGFWRSVGHSHNAFFSESFIDELAAATKQDPLAFRLHWLKDAPHYAAVLQLAADQAGWGLPLPAGRARGLALHRSFGSIVAQVAEVSLIKGQIHVHRVVCAIDCGTVVNPGTVAQQMESSVIFGLSAALFGQIDIVGGVVQQSNFPSYPMVTLSQAPTVETHIVPSTRHPAGVGEPAVPPLAPAVGNALFALTGKRQRALPLKV